MLGARLFVLAVFTVLGISFLATTATLAWEFQDHDWLDFASFDSHLFVFFPTLGVLALVAFFAPSSVLVDLYWRGHVRHGRLRFTIGTMVVALLSVAIAQSILSSRARSMWEIAPDLLAADRGEPAGCAERDGMCQRMPLRTALANLRQAAASRYKGLGDLARDCTPAANDPLVEFAQGVGHRAFCFASTPLSAHPKLQTNAECCRAQARIRQSVIDLYADPARRSLTAHVHALLLPFKVFFLVVLLVISILLAWRHRLVETHYEKQLGQVEIGLFAGSIAVLFFPLMSQAFVQSTEALAGAHGQGVFTMMVPILSFLFMVWALLIALFFYRRKGKNESFLTVGRMGGLIASNVGIIKYNLVIAAFVWALGVGASPLTFAILVIFCLAAVGVVLWASLASRPGDTA